MVIYNINICLKCHSPPNCCLQIAAGSRQVPHRELFLELVGLAHREEFLELVGLELVGPPNCMLLHNEVQATHASPTLSQHCYE